MSGSIALMVRFFRKKAGLSQLNLAKLSGVGKTVIFDIENGKETVQLDTLLKVFEALNIKLSFETPFSQAIGEMDLFVKQAV